MRRSSLLDASDFGDDAAQAKAAFHLRMRARGVQDIAVLRAFELVLRQTFVADRYRDFAMRDLALPIACGQTLDEPWRIARMIEALSLERPHRVLQIGAGTGYATAVLAQLAAEIIALERYQTLATAAQERLLDLGVTNAAVVWADGLAVPGDIQPFDRIIVHGLLSHVPESLTARLGDHGIMVCGRPTADGQSVVRVTKTAQGLSETPVCACRFQPIVPGLAGTL